MQAVESVVEAAASQQEPLSEDIAAVSALCLKLAEMLSHGLKPFVSRVPTSSWASYLPPKKASPWAMLQVSFCSAS